MSENVICKQHDNEYFAKLRPYPGLPRFFLTLRPFIQAHEAYSNGGFKKAIRRHQTSR